MITPFANRCPANRVRRKRNLPEPARPTLYRLLRDLEGSGLVRSTWEASAQGPHRRIYRVTSTGTRQLRRDARDLHALSSDLRRFSRAWRALDARIGRRRR
jgi:DNA-binding PadR family transcriptional regulator